MKRAWSILERGGLAPSATTHLLSFTSDMTSAITDADFIQKNALEREDVKREPLAQIDTAAPPSVIVASRRNTTQLLGHDAKRLQVFHALFREGENSVLATSEQMLPHVDSRGPRAAPFDPAVTELVGQLARKHADIPAPVQAGRRVMTLGSANN